jgi:molybdopterin synthase catalytic subunit
MSADGMTGAHPSFEAWLDEIKAGPEAAGIGMYLMHNGVVRGTARDGSPVTGMDLSYDAERLEGIKAEISARPGVIALRAWVNEGRLEVGDDIMRVLIGGDIRENVFGALQEFVRLVKTECVREREMRAEEG